MLIMDHFPLIWGEVCYFCHHTADTGGSELIAEIQKILEAKGFATKLLHQKPNPFLPNPL